MKITQAAAIAILITFIFAILTLGRDLLIPMVLALFIWYLINILTDTILLVRIRGFGVPRAMAFILALAAIMGSLALFTNLISNSINNVIQAAPGYKENIDNLLARGASWFGLEESPQFMQLLSGIDYTGIIQNLGLTLAGFIGNAGLILVYTLFIFLEQKCFLPKIEKLSQAQDRHAKVMRMLHRIYEDTKTYIGIKTFTSLLTGVVSFAIMRVVGLDFAIFWALLIFLFNYIPTIGSIAATVLPSVLSLVQFPSLGPFVAIVVGVTSTQIVVGNIIEPRLMGNTLNLSPIVILLSLGLWGTVWGIPGAILCVPITVLIAIVFSNFDSTRPVAILLSRDGELKT
jgi:predicted PurR-regulated permease PerM